MENKNVIKFECVECCEVIEISSIENMDLNDDIKDALIREEICFECFENDYFICEECGELHNNEKCVEIITGYNEYIKVCEECAEYNNDIYYNCNECGTWYHMNYMERYDVDVCGYNEAVCHECVNSDNDIFYCDYHEQYEKSEYYHNVSDYGIICEDAYYNGGFAYCEDCSTCHDVDTMECIDDCLYCSDCAEDNHKCGRIESYHANKSSHMDYHKIKNIEDNVLTFGFELEVERGDSSIYCEDMSEILYDNMDGLTVYENDGSLDDGFEIISRPFDLQYYNEEGKDLINNMLNTLKENNFLSHDPGTCGLHFHVGRAGLGNTVNEQHKTLKNISIILEYFKEELTKLSRRSSSHLNRWSKFLTANYGKESLKAEYITNLMENSYERYSALNLRNNATIEFRFFRGTLKNSSFHAAFELIYNIVAYSKDHELINDLNELNFIDIITYQLNDYIEEYANNRLKLKVLA